MSTEYNNAAEMQLKEELTVMLVNELPEILVKIRTATNQDNTDTIFQLAHKIHSACVFCELPLMEEASVELEKACRHRLKATIPNLVTQLENQINKFLSTYVS